MQLRSTTFEDQHVLPDAYPSQRLRDQKFPRDRRQGLHHCTDGLSSATDTTVPGSALHCLEKYVKGILLLNRVNAKNLKHSVLPGTQRVKH